MTQEHIYIVRRPKEWLNYSYLTITNNKILQELVNSWNSVFNISYLDFRKTINKIREYNLQNTQFKNIINWYDKTQIYQQVMSNNLIYCTDDDDWYHDNIIDIIESHKKENCKAFRWNYLAYTPKETMLLTKQEKWGKYFLYQSNNYVLKTPLKFPFENCSQLEHGFINHKYNFSDEYFITDSLSCHNKSLASRSLYYVKPKIQDQ